MCWQQAKDNKALEKKEYRKRLCVLLRLKEKICLNVSLGGTFKRYSQISQQARSGSESFFREKFLKWQLPCRFNNYA